MKYTLCLLLFAALRAAAAELAVPPDRPLPVPKAHGHYLVVISGSTAAQAEWRDVADILRRKHDAGLVIVPDGRPEAALPTLRRVLPRYVCFVARPEEAGRDFVVRVQRLLRRVDDDPYGDATWGILTGYEAADARRLAERAAPLKIGSGFSSMGPGLARGLGAGFACSETDATAFWQVDETGNAEKIRVKPDPTAALARAFTQTPPEVMHTSGHATERDWQIGYTVKAGQFRCDKGQLYARGTDGSRHDIDSPKPKVYLPMGNCLIGHVSGRDCMTTAWIHTGGVHQMYGYTAVTFYGYLGWGVNTYFGDGHMTLSQAFRANCQALLHQLQTRFPAQAGIQFESFHRKHIRRTARRHGIGNRDLLGLLWDRDTVAFYGDPAWEARMPLRPRSWRAELTRREGPNQEAEHTLTLTTLSAGKWRNRPVLLPLTERLCAIRDVTASGVSDPLVMDDFILLPLSGKYAANTNIEVRFRAKACKAPLTSAAAPPVELAALTANQRDVVAATPAKYRQALSASLLLAGENRVALVQAQRDTPDAQRPAMAFLIANMPEPDLHALTAPLLVEHVALAWKAWQEASWHEQIDETLFLDAVLPYATLDERREAWMPEMRRRCLPLIEGCRTPGEAAIALNRKLFGLINVRYHATKRPKPNQSPAESIAAGYASCTGLSIFLVDACRSVGVPARIAGVPRWTGKRGNHTWVEVWDGGDWHAVGAAESTALDKVWFRSAAAKADPSHRLTRIYATQYRRSATKFPLVWDLGYTHVSAVDVTARYQSTANAAN